MIQDAAGLEAAPSAQGRNLFGGPQPLKAVYAEEDHEGNVLESIRTTQWKLILANEGNPRGLEAVELYNIAADPGETNNLADSKSDVVAQLRQDLESLRQVAAASAVAGATGTLDSADEERLRLLGYIE